jgi:hypothetical protein
LVGTAGILINTSADNHILGNQITTGSTYEAPSQGGTGIEVRAAANVIEGNMVFWCDRGIEVYNPLQTIVGNRVEMNLGSGIYVRTDQGTTITRQLDLPQRCRGTVTRHRRRYRTRWWHVRRRDDRNLIAYWNAWTQQQHKQRYGIVYRGNSSTLNNVNTGNVFQGMVVANTHTIA